MIRIGGMGNKRSPFSLNTIELAIALGAGITTWFGLRDFLFWFTEGRQELFRLFAIPMAITMAISAIFLLRGVRNQETTHFTRLSNIAIAWPIFSFITMSILSPLGLQCLPIGLILACIEFAASYKSEFKWGGVAAIAWNVTWLFIVGYYGYYGYSL